MCGCWEVTGTVYTVRYTIVVHSIGTNDLRDDRLHWIPLTNVSRCARCVYGKVQELSISIPWTNIYNKPTKENQHDTSTGTASFNCPSRHLSRGVRLVVKTSARVQLVAEADIHFVILAAPFP